MQTIIIDAERAVLRASRNGDIKIKVENPKLNFIADLDVKEVIEFLDKDELLEAISEAYDDSEIAKWFMSKGSM